MPAHKKRKEGRGEDIRDVKHNPSQKRNHCEGGEQPNELGLRIHSRQCKVDRSRDGGLELVEGHDDGFHPVRCLLVCVLQRSDVGENLSNSNKDVRTSDDPYVQRRMPRFPIITFTRRRLINPFRSRKPIRRTRIGDVNVMLQNSSIDHSGGNDEKAGSDPFDGCESDFETTEAGVDEAVEDGDEDDDGDGV